MVGVGMVCVLCWVLGRGARGVGLIETDTYIHTFGPRAFLSKHPFKHSDTRTPEQKCLSNCMYFCTKPKGEAQRSRAECLPGCKEEWCVMDCLGWIRRAGWN